jgi:hypothetical protein
LLENAGKACKGETHQLTMKIRKSQTKKFYNIGPQVVVMKKMKFCEYDRAYYGRPSAMRYKESFVISVYAHYLVPQHSAK